MSDSAATGGAPTRLWGGRFGGGPSDALARLSVSVHFDWRLAPYDLAGVARARPRPARRRPARRRRARPAMLDALDELDAAVARRRVPADASTTRTSTPPSSAACSNELGALGGKLRAGRSRNDQVATDLRLYLRDHARQVAARVAELRDRADRPGRARTAAPPMPGMTHLQHAQPVLLAHHLLAHVHAFKRDVERLVDWDVRAALIPLGAGALAGFVAAARPGGRRRRARLHRRRCANSIDAVSDRDFVAEFLLRRGACSASTCPALGEEICLWATTRVRLGRARRRLLDRVVDHAAEEEPRHRRAGPRQVRPADRQPDRRCSPRSRACRWPTTATCRRTRSRSSTRSSSCCCVLPAVAGMVATLRVRRRADGGGRRHRATPWPPTSPSGWCAAGSPFRDAHEIAGALVRCCDERELELWEVDDDDLAAVDARLTPERALGAVGRAARSPRARRYGGTAPARVRRAAVRRCADAAHAHAAWASRVSADRLLTPDVLGPAGRSRSRPRPAGARSCGTSAPRARSPSGSPRSRRTPGSATPARTPSGAGRRATR